MKEEHIRPSLLMEENAKLREIEVKALVMRKDEFVTIPCPACELKDYQFTFKKEGVNFVTCNECETVFINPRPPLDMLEEFYATAESRKHWNEKMFPVSEDSRRNHIFAPRVKQVVELCSKVGIKDGILMDVGAGFGTFCEEVAKKDFFKEVIAVEPSPGLASTCRSKGIKVIEDMIENIEIDNINVITNFELIEHLYWPKDFLKACNKALPPGGFLIITTPNIKGFDISVLGVVSNAITVPGHLNYFHPASLSLLLKACGFETVDVFTPGKLDAELVRKKILSGEFDISQQPFLKNILIDNWEKHREAFQKFIAENKLSSHLWVVARKL